MQDMEINEPVDETRLFVVGPDPLATEIAVRMKLSVEAEVYVCTKPYRQLRGQDGSTVALLPGWEKTEYKVTPLQDVMLEKGVIDGSELSDPAVNGQTMISFFKEHRMNICYLDEHGDYCDPHGT